MVQPFRDRFDPSAALGVPAHITLLYPFIAPERIGADTLDAVAACFRGFAPIAFSLTEVRRFPAETLYLAPAPDEPFRATDDGDLGSVSGHAAVRRGVA